jgi:hypothetical protein
MAAQMSSWCLCRWLVRYTTFPFLTSMQQAHVPQQQQQQQQQPYAAAVAAAPCSWGTTITSSSTQQQQQQPHAAAAAGANSAWCKPVPAATAGASQPSLDNSKGSSMQQACNMQLCHYC